MSDESALSAEAKATVELFAKSVNSEIVRMGSEINKSMQRLEDRIDDRIRDLGTEVRGDIAELKDDVAEIKVEQREQRSEQVEQGKDLVQVVTRLESGEKRFDEQASKITKLEERQMKNGKEKAFSAGAGAVAGGGIGYLLKTMFTG